MSKMKYQLLLSSLVLIVNFSVAQNIDLADTVRWSTSDYTDSLLNISGVSTAEFVVYGTSHIKWTPVAGDQASLLFDVDALQGSWNEGFVVYTVVRNGLTRRIAWIREGATTSVIMRWTDTGGKPRKLTYTVSQMTKL